MKSEDIIRVSSVSVKLAGGRAVSRFGYDGVSERIIANLRETVAEKIPFSLRAIGKEEMDEWLEDCIELIDSGIKFYNHLSSPAHDSAAADIDERTAVFRGNFARRARAMLDEAARYFSEFGGEYRGIAAPRAPDFSYDMDASDKATFMITMVIFPIGLIVAADMIRDEMKLALKRVKRKLGDWIENYVAKAKEAITCSKEAA
jgi:hypothetical protein